MSKEYNVCTEPLWCEDCEHFEKPDMSGEGHCDKIEGYTWYGRQICHSYTPKGANDEMQLSKG